MENNYEELLRRLETIKHVESVEELAELFPPELAPVLRDSEFRLEELERVEKVLLAMTLEERLNPKLLRGDAGRPRRERIAQATRTDVLVVESLMRQFDELLRMLATMSPDEITQELIDQSGGPREDWQQGQEDWRKAHKPANWRAEDEDEDEEPRVLITPPPPSLDEQLDAVLRKIHAQGMDALSEREREVLSKASERARVRRQKG